MTLKSSIALLSLVHMSNANANTRNEKKIHLLAFALTFSACELGKTQKQTACICIARVNQALGTFLTLESDI